MQTRSQKSQANADAAIARLRAMQLDLLDNHGIRSYIDGCRLVAKVASLTGRSQYSQVRVENGKVVWGEIPEDE